MPCLELMSSSRTPGPPANQSSIIDIDRLVIVGVWHAGSNPTVLGLKAQGDTTCVSLMGLTCSSLHLKFGIYVRWRL